MRDDRPCRRNSWPALFAHFVHIMTDPRRVFLALVLSGATVAWHPAGLASSRSPVQTGNASQVQATIADARQAMSAGRASEATAIAQQLVTRDPRDRDAVEILITARIAAGQVPQALDGYDAYVGRRGQADVALLALVARAELRAIGASPDPLFGPEALARLAGDGDADALRALKGAAGAPAQHLATLVSLARLGDREAVASLRARVTATAPEVRAEAIQAVQRADIREIAPQILAALHAPEPQVRTAAAVALGVLQYAAAAERLHDVFERDTGIVRMAAAVALKRLGRPDADAFVAQMLTSEMSEVRLMAGEAYQASRSTQWVPKVRELLSDRNELYRVRAAGLIAVADPDSARRALLAALNSPMPPLRYEAARLLERTGLADASVARRLLGDAYEGVRLHGAGAILRLNASSRKVTLPH